MSFPLLLSQQDGASDGYDEDAASGSWETASADGEEHSDADSDHAVSAAAMAKAAAEARNASDGRPESARGADNHGIQETVGESLEMPVPSVDDAVRPPPRAPAGALSTPSVSAEGASVAAADLLHFDVVAEADAIVDHHYAGVVLQHNNARAWQKKVMAEWAILVRLVRCGYKMPTAPMHRSEHSALICALCVASCAAQKESLPESIWVRCFEERTDLLRAVRLWLSVHPLHCPHCAERCIVGRR